MAAAVTVEKADVLQSFWGLSSLDEEKRVESSRELITALLKKQSACAEGEVSADVQYTVQRLVRGLASGRKGARRGFFIALTECPAVKVSEVMKLVKMHLQPHSGIKGAEEKGVYFGHFFALAALLLSGRLTDKEEILEVARQLGAIATKKPFMVEVCTVAMANLVERVCCHDDGEDVRLGIVREGGVCEGWEGCTPERLYMYLRVGKGLNGVVWWEQLARRKWKRRTKNAIRAENLNDLVCVLEMSGSSHPRLHSVWQYVLETVRGAPLFPEFWERVVEGSLMGSTLKKRLMAIRILESILPNLSINEVAVVFSANLLRCILYNATSPSNYLYTPTRELLDALSSCEHLPQEVRVSLYTHLQYRTGGNFDTLTKSEVMKNLLSSLDCDGTKCLVDSLEEIFHLPENLTRYFESDDLLSEPCTVQIWVADQLLAIIKNRSCKKSSQTNLSVAKFFLSKACYDQSSPSHCATPIPPDVRRVLLARLTSVLADLCTLVPASKRVVELGDGDRGGEGGGGVEGGQRSTGRMEDTGELYVVALLSYAQQLPSLPLQDEALAAWEYVEGVFGEMGGGDGGLQIEERAFQLLFATVGLHLLIDPSSVCESVEDLKQCYSDMKRQLQQDTTSSSPPLRKPSSSSPSPPSDETSLNWVEVLVDLLLSFLSQSSQLWRSVVEQVFRQIVHRMTPGVVQLISNVLQPQTKDELMEEDESEGGEGEMSEDGEEEREGGEGEMSEDGEEEREGGEGECEEKGEGEGEGGEGESEGDDSDDEEEDKVDEQFRDDIMKALGSAVAQSEDESEVSMSDGEMERVDEALAAVFRTKRAQQSSKKDEVKTIVHFKLRVLDLVQIILQRHHSNPVILDFILPLYHMIRSSRNSTDHTPLVSRAVQIFRSRLCRPKKLPRQSLDGSQVHPILHELVQCLYKANDQQSMLILNNGILYLIKLLVSCKSDCPSLSPITTRAGRKRKREAKQQETPPTLGSLDVAVVTGWLSDALHSFITKKNSNVPHQIFFSLAERYPVLAWQLIGKMVEDLSCAANRFRKVQGLEVLSLLLAAKIDNKVFAEVAMPHVEAMVLLCTKELSDCRQRPEKQVKPVLKLVLKLATSLKEHGQWEQFFQQSLINALHPLYDDEGCGEVTRRECDRVMSVLGEVGEVGERGEGEGEGTVKRSRRGSRRPKKRTKK